VTSLSRHPGHRYSCVTSILSPSSLEVATLVHSLVIWALSVSVYVCMCVSVCSFALFSILVTWSVIYCQDSCIMGSPKAHGQKSISVTIFTNTTWRTLDFPTLVVGHHWSLGATFLGSLGDWLWELVSPRIHASPPTLWSVLPTCWGSAWVCCKLSNVLDLRSGTGSWVLSGKSGTFHPLSSVIRLGLRK